MLYIIILGEYQKQLLCTLWWLDCAKLRLSVKRSVSSPSVALSLSPWSAHASVSNFLTANV